MWTNFFDLVCKLCGLAVAIAVMASLHGVVPRISYVTATVVVGGFVIGALSWWFLFRPLSSWLYARIRLRAKLSWSEARRASCLFSPVLEIVTWSRVEKIRSLPEAQRVPAILTATKEVRAQFDVWKGTWRQMPRRARMFLWGSGLLIVGVVIGSFIDVPPFSWVSHLQADWFGGKSYSPAITSIVILLPLCIPLAFLALKLGFRFEVTESHPRGAWRLPVERQSRAGMESQLRAQLEMKSFG